MRAYIAKRNLYQLHYLRSSLGRACRKSVLLVDSVTSTALLRLSFGIRCANNFQKGGRLNHNAGGVCADTTGSGRPQIQFLQELSHHKFYPSAFPLGMAVRSWCMLSCFCVDLPYMPGSPDAESSISQSRSHRPSRPSRSSQSSRTTVEIPWLSGLNVEASNGGLSIGPVVLVPPGNWGTTGQRYQLTPSPYPLNLLPWPTEPWLPLPAGYVEPSLEELLADPQYRTYRFIKSSGWQSDATDTCQGSCNGPCGAQCSCSVVGGKEAGWNGEDPVFPLTMVRCMENAISGSWFGKRDDEDVLGCVCNASYVSLGCCGSLDGVVWEDSEQKLGTLDLT